VLPVGSLTSGATGVVGFMAVAIAVFGFLWQAPSALAHKQDETVRAATMIGGLVGFGFATAVILADYLW
jgi:uncharacterized membrane protein